MVTTSVLPGSGMMELSTRPSKIRLGPPRWISHRKALFFEASKTTASRDIVSIRAGLRLGCCNVKQIEDWSRNMERIITLVTCFPSSSPATISRGPRSHTTRTQKSEMEKRLHLTGPTALSLILLAGMTLAEFAPVVSFQFINVGAGVYVTADR